MMSSHLDNASHLSVLNFMNRTGNFRIFIFSILFLVSIGNSQSQELQGYSIIPQVQHEKYSGQIFTLPEAVYLKISKSFQLSEKAILKDLGIQQSSDPNAFNIELELDSSLQPEAYILELKKDKILMSASGREGIMWGIASLSQILRLSTKDVGGHLNLQEVSIIDYPAYKHRGLLLDCSRHFFSKETIKKYIDLLSLYKLNTLHWHLVDDQGWRVEIKKYPKLTEIGSNRTEGDGSIYGGFYSQLEIKEIVAYAQSKGVNIIPEIELPGHSQAALAAYPQYSCLGKDIVVANDWGVFKEIYCAGNDSTFIFLEGILDEILDLFPSKKIHIGGDEAPSYRWEHCTKCQKRMVSEGLDDSHQLQPYFINRIGAYLHAKGRSLIGWDEILDGGAPKNSIIQAWRGIDKGREGLESGYKTIMSPTSHCYLDYGLDAIDLEKIYTFNPVPKGISDEQKSFILGAECNMWTEYVTNEIILDEKVFPRMIGFAANIWKGDHRKSYSDFYSDLQFHYPLLDSIDVKYGLESISAKLSSICQNETCNLKISSTVPNLTFEHRFDGKIWEPYDGSLPIEKSGILEVRAFKKENQYGPVIQENIAYHKSIGAPRHYTNQWSDWYKAEGEMALGNGLRGSFNFRDGRWQGFSGDDLNLKIELNGFDTVKTIQAQFYQYNNAWIFFPNVLEVYGSEDGEKWKLLKTVSPEIDPKKRGKHIWTAQLNLDRPNIWKYLKVIGKNIKKVPDWHEAAGSDAWIFVDEIEVY